MALENEATRPADALAIRNQMQAWDRALLEGAPQILGRILSRDFFGAGLTREAYEQAVRTMGVKYTESSRDNLQLRFFGDTAVVTGQWTQRGSTEQFGSFMTTFSFTELWVKEDGAWKCVTTAPDKVRQAHAGVPTVRIGPDVKADVVILYAAGASDAEIEQFRKRHLSERREPPYIQSYTVVPSIDGHEAVALQFHSDHEEMAETFFIKALLSESIVFRVFEDIAPANITLAK